MPKVLIVDDHALIREGLHRALSSSDFEVVGEAATLEEAKVRYEKLNPDTVIIDINLGVNSGLDLARWIREKSRDCALVVLTMDDRESTLREAKQAEVNAYVLKEAPLTELISALKFVRLHPNKFFLRSPLTASVETTFNLTKRESEILSLLPDGLSNREMASLLFVSESTVKTHLISIYRKLQVENRIRAIEVARSRNFFAE